MSPAPGQTAKVYRLVIGYFTVVFFAMVWPLAVPFARARPLVAGVPFSLAYLVVLLVLSFGVLLALFLWEGRQGVDQD